MTKRLCGLQRQERASASALMQAFNESRKRQTITRMDRQLVRPSEADQLNAANPYARIKWGNALWTEFSHRFHLFDETQFPDVPLFWVTLVDTDCFTKCDATEIDIAWMGRRLRRDLRGLSYIGMFDPAYYVNVAHGTRFVKRRGVNWHLHLFVWRITRKEIKVLVATLNENGPHTLRPIIPNGVGAHWNEVTAETLPIRFRYMLKWPQKAYRIGRRRSLKFKHNRADLRKGERVTVFHLLKRLGLPELTVVGGEGVALKRRSLAKASRSAPSDGRRRTHLRTPARS